MGTACTIVFTPGAENDGMGPHPCVITTFNAYPEDAIPALAQFIHSVKNPEGQSGERLLAQMVVWWASQRLGYESHAAELRDYPLNFTGMSISTTSTPDHGDEPSFEYTVTSIGAADSTGRAFGIEWEAEVDEEEHSYRTIRYESAGGMVTRVLYQCTWCDGQYIYTIGRDQS